MRKPVCIILSLAIAAGLASPALADTTAEVTAQLQSFEKATNACDIPGMLAVYEENAIVIWPGQGDEATGKPAIEKLVGTLCKGPQKHAIKMESLEVKPLGKNYVVNIGHWADSVTGPDGKTTVFKIRTSEVMRKSGGQWRYVVDHASIGLPPAPPAKSSP
jgi:uncharacterized protein (TIGR02246 family)